MCTQKFSDADRHGCGECPRNPENREYLKQRGASSGIDGRPKVNPVLGAIDDAVQPENSGITTEQHNEMLDDIRSAYLQRHPQGPEVSGRTTNYYICPNCQCPIDMTGTGLDGLVAPGDGGEFEQAVSLVRRAFEVTGTVFTLDQLSKAHNADMFAATEPLRRRIAEFETTKSYPCTMGVGEGSGNMFVHGDYESIKHLQGKLLQMVVDKQRIAELEEQLTLALKQRDCESERSSKRMDEIVELRDQLSDAQKPRVMKRYTDEKPRESGWYWYAGSRYGIDRPRPAFYAFERWSIHDRPLNTPIFWLELEPAPTIPPETSGDKTKEVINDKVHT